MTLEQVSKKSTERFSNRVMDYVRYRPSYPKEVLEYLNEHLGLSPHHRIADIGSGTGIFTELLLKNENEVFAVEPNAPMREVAENNLGDFPYFHSISGTAEETTLADQSLDFITSAQAFHWFDLEKAKTEFKRILRPQPHAQVILIWNVRDMTTTPFARDYENLIQKFSTDYAEVRHQNVQEKEVMSKFFAPHSFQQRSFTLSQLFDLKGLEGRLASSSYALSRQDPQFSFMQEAFSNLFQKYQLNGQVQLDYTTEVFHGPMHS